MTMPPLLWAAIAIGSTSPIRASRLMQMLPWQSAVVPRIRPTVIGKALYQSHRLPPSSIASTRSSLARSLSLPPLWAGSMNVSRPTWVIRPGRLGGDLAEELADHALREVVGLDLVLDRELAQARREVPVAADDAA